MGVAFEQARRQRVPLRTLEDWVDSAGGENSGQQGAKRATGALASNVSSKIRGFSPERCRWGTFLTLPRKGRTYFPQVDTTVSVRRQALFYSSRLIEDWFPVPRKSRLAKP
jgi:hypothetical protein